jgi:hypothetical protein
VRALCEVRVFSRQRRYAGTLDVLGLWRGAGALVDYKTGNPADVGANLQTAAYDSALSEMLQNGDHPDELVFDAPSHTYYLDGERVPSVTQVLEWAHIIDFSHVPDPWRQMALDRGSAVHQAAHEFNEARFNGDAFAAKHPIWMPYVQAWIDFRRASGFEMATQVPDGYLARYAVRLKKSGRYSVEAYTDPTDSLEFDKLVVAWHAAAPYFNAWPKYERALAEAA